MKKILLGLCVILGLINMIGCSSDEKVSHADLYRSEFTVG